MENQSINANFCVYNSMRIRRIRSCTIVTSSLTLSKLESDKKKKPEQNFDARNKTIHIYKRVKIRKIDSRKKKKSNIF